VPQKTSEEQPNADEPEKKPEEQIDPYLPRPKSPPILSAETENLIKEYWMSTWKLEPEDFEYEPRVHIVYYGTYNHCIALTIVDNISLYPALAGEEIIDGVIFPFNGEMFVRIWYNGNFIQLRSAYEQGLLTQEDLKDIQHYYCLYLNSSPYQTDEFFLWRYSFSG